MSELTPPGSSDAPVAPGPFRSGNEVLGVSDVLDRLEALFRPDATGPRRAILRPPAPGPPITRRNRTPIERDERPVFVVGVSTWNRLDYVRRFVESFQETRSQDFNFVLVIADDGSTDGTLDYLETISIPDCQVVVIENKGRTIAGQANSIFQVAQAVGFDFGMKCDDDIFFTTPGWDQLYFSVATSMGKDHLVYHNAEWKPAVHDVRKGPLHSSVPALDCLGCLYTFTPEVLDQVGFMDGAEFEFRGHSHMDFTMRCCRAGFNDEATLWDAAGSSDHIGMWPREQYVNLVDWDSDEVKAILSPQERARRMELIQRPERIHVDATRPHHALTRSRFIVKPLGEGIREALMTVPTLIPREGLTREFDGVFVLNLSHDSEKWMVTAGMLASHGLDFERFPAVDGNQESVAAEWRAYAARGLTHEVERQINRKLIQSPGAWGYLKTMEAILEHAKANRMRRILVFDDDIMLHTEFEDRFEELWNLLPSSWKLFYLGRSQVDREVEVPAGPGLVHPRQGANGSFAVAIDHTVFDLALEQTRLFEWPFDSGPLRAIDASHPDETLAAEPPLVIADVSDSAIRAARDLERFATRHGWTTDDFDRRPDPAELSRTETLVTVLVPCNGNEPSLGDAMHSLRLQTHGALEIIVVAVGITPAMSRSVDLLRRRDSRVTVVVADHGSDESDALNAAIRLARGEVIVIHAPTEVSSRNRIEACVRSLEAHDATWVSAPSVAVDHLPPAALADGEFLTEWAETTAAGPTFQSWRVGAFRAGLLRHLGGLLASGEAGGIEIIERARRWPRRSDHGLSEAQPISHLCSVVLSSDDRYRAEVDLSQWETLHREVEAGIRSPRMTPTRATVSILGAETSGVQAAPRPISQTGQSLDQADDLANPSIGADPVDIGVGHSD